MSPDDLTRAEEVLDDMIAKNPDLQDDSIGGKNTRAKCSDVKLTQFLQSRGTVKMTESKKTRPKWDKEIFDTQLKLLRGWTQGRCNSEWEELKRNTPVSERGQGGPPEAPLQLPLPAAMIGTETLSDATQNFAKKEMQVATKAAVMSEEATDAAVSDCAKNFGNVGACFFVASFRSPPGSSN